MSGVTDPETIAVMTDVGAAAQALAAIFKAADDLFMALNSPTMLAARKNADVQKAISAMDSALFQAQKTGNLTKLDSEVSG